MRWREPKRTTLARLRQRILEIVPEAEQGIAYGVPAFKVRGKTIAGFAAFKDHLRWANERSGSHVHASAWMGAGRRTTNVDLNAAVVDFVR